MAVSHSPPSPEGHARHWLPVRLMRELIVHRRQLRYATVYLPEPGPMLAMMLLQFVPGFRPKRLVLTFHGSEILKFYRDP